MVNEPDEAQPRKLSPHEPLTGSEPSPDGHDPSGSQAAVPRPSPGSDASLQTAEPDVSAATGEERTDPTDSGLDNAADTSEDSSWKRNDTQAQEHGGYVPEDRAERFVWDQEEEEGGGPVKSFLEHLEDLRWTIIRCLAALVIAMVVCLVAGNKLVEVLKEPLLKAQKLSTRPEQPMALLEMGTNRWVLNLKTNQFGPVPLGSNTVVKLVMAPVQIGTNLILGLTPAPFDPEELPPANQITIKNYGPVSPFAVVMKIALFGGIGLASPFILFFIGQFVVPALRRQEKKYLYIALAIGSGLFCAGVFFCYYFMLQVALNAAVQFSSWMGFGADEWRAEDYIGFVVKFMLGMGLSFELPVVLLTLVKLGLLDYERLSKFRPYWVVVNMVIAALLTPPDVVSQLLMAIPLQLLYELSVFIAWIWHRRDQKRLAEEEAA